MHGNLTSYWTITMANNGHYILNEYNNIIYILDKTMVTVVYQMKTNKGPSLLATKYKLKLKYLYLFFLIIFFKTFSQVKTK